MLKRRRDDRVDDLELLRFPRLQHVLDHIFPPLNDARIAVRVGGAIDKAPKSDARVGVRQPHRPDGCTAGRKAVRAGDDL